MSKRYSINYETIYGIKKRKRNTITRCNLNCPKCFGRNHIHPYIFSEDELPCPNLPKTATKRKEGKKK